MTPSTPYAGLSRKLLIALDVGTTFSGVSYSILDPGNVPKITPVTRYPAQEHAGGDSKIPSIIYYDNLGMVRACGAEAVQESIIEQAEDEGWVKAEWFKMHLRPRTLSASHIGDNDIPPLPMRKTVIQVFSDYLKYLFKCTKEYIIESHANGDALWTSVEESIDFVLTHPNGWGGAQQSMMRRAAVRAGLVPDGPESQTRIQFCSEGEACLHFCIESSLTSAVVASGEGVIVVDAGGGTIDLSAYVMRSLVPKSFEEIAPAECRLQGSIFVSRRARTFLEEKLRGTKYGTPKDIADMATAFDRNTKTKFRDSAEVSYVKFGSARDSDPASGIRSGQLKVLGTDVAALFEPSIRSIVEAVQLQRRNASMPISAIFLVGGFAASDWLFSRLQAALHPLGLTFSRPDQHVNKAVSDGAVSFYLNHFVSTRVAKWSYGTEVCTVYDSNNAEHRIRAHTQMTRPSGKIVIPHKWDPIISKGTRVSESTEFRSSYSHEATEHTPLKFINTSIQCYIGGSSTEPKWVDLEPGMFPDLCRIIADTSVMANSLTPLHGARGHYYTRRYDVVMLFGLTELKAQLSWMENGVEKRSPAAVVYDESPDESIRDDPPPSPPRVRNLRATRAGGAFFGGLPPPYE